MSITKEARKELLACNNLPDFLTLLRRTLPEDAQRQEDVAALLARYGGTSHKQAVYFYESGRRGLTSSGQLAYARAFDLDAELRLRLQELAGAVAERACA
jgi:hypothetical protein